MLFVKNTFLFLPCSVVAEKSPSLLFTRPKKLIRSWGPEASVLGYVGIGTLSEGTCRYDLNEEDVAWLELANREFTQMGECVLNSLLSEPVYLSSTAQFYSWRLVSLLKRHLWMLNVYIKIIKVLLQTLYLCKWISRQILCSSDKPTGCTSEQ